MRLVQEKLVCDSKATFGDLMFMEFDSERFERDEEGNSTGVVTRRAYNLYSVRQGEMIKVFIPAEVPLKEFKEEEKVELIDVNISSIVDSGYGNKRTYYIVAGDMVKVGEKKAQGQPVQMGYREEMIRSNVRLENE